MTDATTRVGHVVHDDVDVYVGRAGPDGTHDHVAALQGRIAIGEPGWLGNPYPVEQFGREQAIAMFTEMLLTTLRERPRWRHALVRRCPGQVLGCWCRRLADADPPCHGDVIARVVDDVITSSQGVEHDEAVVTDGGRSTSRPEPDAELRADTGVRESRPGGI